MYVKIYNINVHTHRPTVHEAKVIEKVKMYIIVSFMSNFSYCFTLMIKPWCQSSTTRGFMSSTPCLHLSVHLSLSAINSLSESAVVLLITRVFSTYLWPFHPTLCEPEGHLPPPPPPHIHIHIHTVELIDSWIIDKHFKVCRLDSDSTKQNVWQRGILLF